MPRKVPILRSPDMAPSSVPPVDPAHADELPLPAGSTVVLAVPPGVRGERWVGRTARLLASGWAGDAEGGVVLVDADLARPHLTPPGQRPPPGLGDLMAGRGELGALLLEARDAPVHLLAAGSFPADPWRTLRPERWREVWADLSARGGRVVVVLPLGEPWSDAVLHHADTRILLAADPEEPGVHLEDPWLVLAPGGGSPPSEWSDAPTPRPTPADPAQDGQEAPPPPDEPTPAPTLRPSGAVPASGTRPATEAGARRRGRTGRDSVVPFIMAVVLVLGGGALFLAWLGSGEPQAPSGVPEPDVREDPVQAPESAPADPAATGSTSAVSDELRPRFAVRLGSFTDAENARVRRVVVQEAAPGLWVGLAPVELDSTVYHRVLGGLAPDSLRAVGLRDSLAGALGTSPDDWLVEPASMAWEVAVGPDRAAAESRASDLRDRGLPAYVLETPHPGGSSTWRVYVGAYAEGGEGAYLGELLRAEGMNPVWAPRVGRPPD